MFQVAGIQMTPIMNDVEANLKRGQHFIQQAAAQEVDLIVLPELWTTGYYLSKESFKQLAEHKDGRTVTLMQDQALRSNASIICPFVEITEDKKLYIAAAVIDHRGELRGTVHKSLLWGREQQIFEEGNIEYPVFDTKIGKVGILICYEMEFPETSRLLALQGVEMIVCPSVWSLSASHRWDIQLPARALDNTVYVFGVNTVGNNSCGKSKLVSPLGDVLAEASDRKEELLIRAIDKEALDWARETVPYLHDYEKKLTPGGVNKIPTPIL
ncbi:Nitrilase/cyanide hydratase and apolipoprotein N-acyltransferase [Alkaliphilus metalliredigens QYMF]|uniref:Nitrilase/cyanide hydratase and apolipoprotein N-acyltransferase n=1 Tax=Alkaliphilus metalliredigens (strain QYMF) TaxID=293826 RepID=A6TPX2_ALKMQ|nr:nitrilase-related carbon-nitrogen hydrolase [Alkaliphilus metalliredigens]ABR48240.1 Nitrilase/cyanide hydratase and apolipoprotein N-acyltransferase [Alkaliphilus metalliredigens QYMF]